MSCPNCPCPGASCPEVYCTWAAESPPDEVKLRHIRARMGCGDTAALDFARPAPDARPLGLARELVVCRFKEDVGWLDGVPPDVFVSLLDKSDEPHSVARQARRVRLPNVGREAHSMAWWIVEHYHDLAGWTYFAQGDAPFHSPDFLGRLGVDYGGVCSLTETYSPTHPPPETHAHDRVEWHGGYRVAYGDAEAPCGAALNTADRLPFWNPAVWPYVFACPRPERIHFGYAAQWAVPRGAILARPRGFWRWLRDEIARARSDVDAWADPPLTPWKMEALWLYLFSDPCRYPHRPDREGPTPAEAIGLARRMGACPYRSTAGCGCSGGACSLRGGRAVHHLDCFECLRRYP